MRKITNVMLYQPCIRILSSQSCPNMPETTLHKKISCALLDQSAQMYFCRKTGCFRHVWQSVFQSDTIPPNNLGSFCSMLTREFIYNLQDKSEQGPTLTGTTILYWLLFQHSFSYFENLNALWEHFILITFILALITLT